MNRAKVQMKRRGRSFLITAVILVLLVAPGRSVLAGEAMKVVARVDGFTDGRISAAGFHLDRAADIHLEVVGAIVDGKPLTECWILDAVSRKLIWNLENDSCREVGRYGHDCRITLPLESGEYELYYSTIRDNIISLSTKSRFLTGLLEGFVADKFLVKGRDFDREALTDQWGARVLVSDSASARTAFPVPIDRGVRPHELAAVRQVRSKSLARQAFVLAGEEEVEVYAVGESSGDTMYDFGWIIRSEDRQRVWEMEYKNTIPAGGATKNRMALTRLILPAGRYEAWYATDSSHNWGGWNQRPPRDPDYWGITVRLVSQNDTAAAGHKTGLRVFDGRAVIAVILEPGNNQFSSRSILLRQDAPVWLYGIGETGAKRLWDWAWIEDTRTGKVVWEMTRKNSRWAGGASKNRMCDEVLFLEAGEYLVGYATDDSHSAGGGWNSEPPWDRDRAGITVCWLGETSEPGLFLGFAPERSSSIYARIAGVGDQADETASFELEDRQSVLVVCLGEGSSSSMYDYGWLEHTETGERVWTMEFESSQHAGGARKNRIWRGEVTLDPGTYRVRYVSDGSHSFNDWNDDPPDHKGGQWGITVFREQ